jgi:hypothetical protein
MAAAGEMKILAMHVYNCTEDVTCEQAGANKVSVVPEGLGVVGKEELSWEGKLLESPPRLHIGNKAGEPAKQIQWQVKCTGTTGKYNEKWTGELKPELSDGTSIGAAPSKFLFATAGGLKVGLEAEGGIVGGNLKMMGFEGAELISHKNP